MKDFTPTALWAIAEEMLGAEALRVAIVLAALFLLLFLMALVRRRGFNGAIARIGVLGGLMTGAAAALIAPLATQADYANLHGLLDWAALALIGVVACGATIVAVYGVFGAAGRR